MNYCRSCEKAQLNRHLLRCCPDSNNHHVCKTCILDWDEDTGRPISEKYVSYWADMKKYCEDTLGYEPTYLATRILIGNECYREENKEKSVKEFLIHDKLSCYVWRFKKEVAIDRDRPDCTTAGMTTVDFEYIQRQLFPHEEDDWAGTDFGNLYEFEEILGPDRTKGIEDSFNQKFTDVAIAITSDDPEEVKIDLCICCYSEPINAIFVHDDSETSHSCCCMTCAKHVQATKKRCPMCNVGIQLVVQNFGP